jgi:radical SAM superfamily enzyme YgiQ (UPF0313 family)
MHVTLVNPPYPPGSHQHAPFISLGILYLAAVLEKNHYEVDLIDCQALRLSYENVRKEIEKRQPNIVGVTSTTLTYKSALRIAKIAKEVSPDIFTVLGGCHATFWDDKALQECPQLDVVVRKEGENTLLELVRKIEKREKFANVLGITYRSGGEIFRTPDRPYIENLDELPFPAYHLMPIEHLRKSGELIIPVMTSRGCIFWCDFCTAVRMFGRKHRTRSPKNIVDELELIQKGYSAEEVSFCDDIFTLDQTRTERLCDEIKKRKIKIKWTCGTRVDMVTRELLRKMKDAGCIGIWFGVESGSQKVLNDMHKGISVTQTMKAFKWAHEIGLRTLAQVILGYPGETIETAWQTIKFVEKISPDEVGFYNVATPFPGTPLYDLTKEKGWIKVTDFDKYDTTKPVIETPMLSMKELRQIREQAFLRFYTRPQYILRMFKKGLGHGFMATKTAFTYMLKRVKTNFSPQT